MNEKIKPIKNNCKPIKMQKIKADRNKLKKQKSTKKNQGETNHNLQKANTNKRLNLKKPKNVSINNEQTTHKTLLTRNTHTP